MYGFYKKTLTLLSLKVQSIVTQILKQYRGDVIIVQPRQPGALGTFAGTAAGVAVGTVIGDKITGRSESRSASADGALPVGPCLYEEQQLLGCAQNENELLLCESFRRAWLNCKQKYDLK